MDAGDLRHLVEEIDGDIGVALEDTGLAHVLHRQARGRQVGHRAVFELDADVGDVGGGTHDADAIGADMLHGRLHDGEQDVEVVHHQIEDHGHVGAARIEQGQAVRLNKQRVFDERLGRDEGRVEPLHMAHLHLHPSLIGQLLQGVGLLGRRHDGLLDEDMLAFQQGLRCALKMTDGRRDDVDHVDGIDQSIDGAEAADARFGFHLLGGLLSRVIKAHQNVILYLFDAVDMDFAQMPCT